MSKDRFDGKKLILTESEWKERLTPDQFNVLRKSGTESAFGNNYYDNHEAGTYVCAGCGLPLYSSDANRFRNSFGRASLSRSARKMSLTKKIGSYPLPELRLFAAGAQDT